MTEILVTGANGQLGSELQKLSGNFPYKFHFTDVDVLDITNTDSLAEYCKNLNISFIINCAAYTAVDKAESQTEKAYNINQNAVKNLVNLAKTKNAALIHISTDYVFDGSANVPYREDAQVNPQSAYGKTKLEGEKEALKYDKSIIIRTSWLYSTFGNNIVKTILKLSKERSELKFVFDQVGTPTYAEDLAKAIYSIIEKAEKEEIKTSIFHYSNEGVCSWFDVAWEILNYTHSSCKVFPIESGAYPLPAKRPSYSVLNKQKIKDNFAIEIPYWKNSLYKCINELNKN